MLGALMLGCLPARAEVSAKDGYASDGSSKLHVEIAPYAWVPAVSGDVKLGRGASRQISQGMPSLATLRNDLTGAFMGDVRVRYGAWFGELNIQYIGASVTKGLSPDILGIPRSLNAITNMTRVAPGFGYQAYNGTLGGMPVTLDARVGFAWFTSSVDLKLDRFPPSGTTRVASLSQSDSFAQAWVGFRGALYPWPRWRFELTAQAQGLGIDSGAWGWATSATASWAATDWLNVIGGFMANNTSRHGDSARGIQSLSLTAYGPLLGVSFTF